MSTTDPRRVTIKAVRDRDGGACVICGTTQALNTHHRRPRGMGGDPRPDTNQPQNLLTVCYYHHAYIEREREWSLAMGFLVYQDHDPALTPVKTQLHGWVLLTPEGETTKTTPGEGFHG